MGVRLERFYTKWKRNFNFENPSNHLPALLQSYRKIQQLENKHWAKIKEKEILEIIEASVGLYLEASAASSSAVPNAEIQVQFEALNRSEFTIDLVSLKIIPSGKVIEKDQNLAFNEKLNFKEVISYRKHHIFGALLVKERSFFGHVFC